MDYLKHSLWPFLKVKATYWWWIIKYRGKKNIPPELIFSRMFKSVSGMNDALMNAFRAMPDNLNEQEKNEFLDLMHRAQDLEKEIKDLK